MRSIASALDGLSAQVVVVDNGSVDNTVAVVEAAAQELLLVRSTNTGYSAGINLGFSHTEESMAILILNPDVVLAPRSIRVLFDDLAEPSIGVVVPMLLDTNGDLSRSQRRSPSITRSLGLGFTGHPRLSEIVHQPRAYRTPASIDWATGAVMLIRRRCFVDLDGWDPSFFLYSEETDFCLRAKDRGWTVRFNPAAIATHAAGGSGRSERTQSMQALNHVRLYHRRHSEMKSWIYYLLALAAELSRVLRRRPYAAKTLLALVSPSHRPAELNLARSLLPSDGRGQGSPDRG